MPCGASAVYENGEITMRTFFRDAKTDVRLEMSDTDPIALGRKMAKKTLELSEEE